MLSNYSLPLRRNMPVFLHGAGWLVYLLLIIYVNGSQGTNFLVGHPGIHILAQAAIFYFNYLYCIPVILSRKRIFRFVWMNCAFAATLVVLFIPAYHALRTWYLGSPATPFPLSYSEQFFLRFFELLLFVLIACIIRFAADWFGFEQRAREQENAQLNSELAFLRSQLNPHFLFNTLNALYALAIKNAPETPIGIMHLSQLMRYVLYEADTKVHLSREVEMIENFLELQKLRLPVDFPLSFQVSGETDCIVLDPLLMLPLVENMFKHGSDFARITLTTDTNGLVLRTENGIGQRSTQVGGGIGLRNLQMRLSHLYPGQYRLDFGPNGKVYEAELTITYDR